MVKITIIETPEGFVLIDTDYDEQIGNEAYPTKEEAEREMENHLQCLDERNYERLCEQFYG